MTDLDFSHELPETADLAQVGNLVERERALARQIAEGEELVTRLKTEQRRLLDVDIPSAMAETGLTMVKTANCMVEVVTFVDARLPKATAHEALNWLRTHGFGDLIKHKVSANFGAGEDDQAAHLLQFMMQAGIAPSDDETVHPSTLKAWAKEQVEKGAVPPEDLFGIYQGQTAKIKAL